MYNYYPRLCPIHFFQSLKNVDIRKELDDASLVSGFNANEFGRPLCHEIEPK